MDQKTAEVMVALSEEIDRLWRYLGHSDAAEKARHDASEWRRRSEDLRKELEGVIVKTAQHTTQYLTIAAAIGYGGYFTTWNLTKASLTEQSAAFVGLMGIFSVGVYVLWELFAINIRMRSLSTMNALLRDMVAPDVFEERRREIVRQEARMVQLLTPIWRLVLFFCIGALLLGSGVMVRALYLNLWSQTTGS